MLEQDHGRLDDPQAMVFSAMLTSAHHLVDAISPLGSTIPQILGGGAVPQVRLLERACTVVLILVRSLEIKPTVQMEVSALKEEGFISLSEVRKTSGMCVRVVCVMCRPINLRIRLRYLANNHSAPIFFSLELETNRRR